MLMTKEQIAGHMRMWSDPEKHPLGTMVKKVGGDYSFSGMVVAVVVKKSGAIRYVVEDDRGLLFIFSEANLVADRPPEKV